MELEKAKIVSAEKIYLELLPCAKTTFYVVHKQHLKKYPKKFGRCVFYYLSSVEAYIQDLKGHENQVEIIK